MNDVNIVIMGKTGAGKSTIVNAIFGEDVAKEGDGLAVTKENKVYETNKVVENKEYHFKLYDTVGLEIDERITTNTINEIEKHIDRVEKTKDVEDISVVWFCINSSNNRLEDVEINLLRKVSVERGIPFVVVITQCYDSKKGDLEKQLEKSLPGKNYMRILAKDSHSRIGTFPAFGLDELIKVSIREYKSLKVSMLEDQLQALTQLNNARLAKIENMSNRAYALVHEYEDEAFKTGFIPFLCMPIIHGKVIKMINEINKIFGINGMTEDYIANFIVGLIVTPFMLVPGISIVAASVYVGAIGETYTEALTNVIKESSEQELSNNELMIKKIKSELSRMKGASK